MVGKTTAVPQALTPAQVDQYDAQGYLILRGLFAPAEVQAIRALFDDLATRGQPVPKYWEPKVDPARPHDPLARYPRVMHPHRFLPLARQVLLDARVRAVLVDLLQEEPIAAQTMYYYKPPGARGQAFHQDNFYLEVKPGSCIAAWLAIDPALVENGGLLVAPGTHKLEVICPDMADTDQSFTTHLVKPPPGIEPVPALMEPGDVLFFNGSLIHGSQPNRHASLWRRSFISHYLPRGSKEISAWYRPLLTFDGQEVEYPASPAGGPCGIEQKPVSYDRWH